MLSNCDVVFQTVVKTFECPLDCKEIKPVHPKGNQPWIVIGRTDVEAESPILWPPDAKSQLIGKDPDAGKDWRQEKKGMTVDDTVEWHHWLDGYEFEQALVVGDGQESLANCSPWGCKQSDTTEWLSLSLKCYLSIHFFYVWPFVIPWTVVQQAPLSMWFSRQG